MKENRAISLLKSLSKEELRWFQKFVQSPYHNSNQKLVALYGLLRKLHPEFPPEKTRPEVLFKLLFTRKSFDAPTMRLLLHRLANLLETFIVCEQHKENPFVHEKLLIKSLAERDAYGLFKKKTQKLLEDLEGMPVRDANYYRHLSELQLQYYGHPATDRHRKKSEDLYEGMQNLDTYFTLSKLRLAAAIKSRTNTLAQEAEIPFMNVVLAQSNNEHPLGRLYVQVYRLQSAPNDVEAFNDLLDTFTGNIKLFNLEDKRLVLSVLLNFCARKHNQGLLQYSRVMFELYGVGLEEGCMLYNGEITYVAYTNIAATAVSNKEYDWALKFIEDYAPCLDRSIREEARRHSLGAYYFHRKEYERAHELLYGYNFSKKVIQILVKTLLVRVNIELFLQDRTYFDIANAQLNNLEKYVRSYYSAAPVKLKQYINFIKFARKFLKLKDGNQSTDALLQEVEKADNLALKKWLLEKLKD